MGIKTLSLALSVVLLSGLTLQSYAAYPPSWVVADISIPRLEKPYDSDNQPDVGFRMIAASVVNMGLNELPFVAFLEIRDSTGVTIFLNYHTGVIDIEGRLGIASSWQVPDFEAEYELRAFVISNFTKPQVLTEVKTSQFADL